MEAVQWVRDHGGYVSPKLRVRSIEGAGKCVFCEMPVKRGERLVFVPQKALLNRQTVSLPATMSPLASTHQLLAEYLAKSNDPWITTLPPPSAFDGVPLTWPECYREALPQKYQDHVKRQLAQLHSDFAASELQDFDRFRWAWLCVNTRCLYWSIGGMTLAPFVDFLNHNPDASESVQIDSRPGFGMTVSASHDYEPGQELQLCYGAHENGFLLCEYGFVLDPPSPYEFVDITPDVHSTVTLNRVILESLGYWNDYTVDASGPSFRVLVALASTQNQGRPLKMMVEGWDDGKRFETKSQDIIRSICTRLRDCYRAAEPPRPEIAVLYRTYVQILEANIQ